MQKPRRSLPLPLDRPLEHAQLLQFPDGPFRSCAGIRLVRCGNYVNNRFTQCGDGDQKNVLQPFDDLEPGNCIRFRPHKVGERNSPRCTTAQDIIDWWGTTDGFGKDNNRQILPGCEAFIEENERTTQNLNQRLQNLNDIVDQQDAINEAARQRDEMREIYERARNLGIQVTDPEQDRRAEARRLLESRMVAQQASSSSSEIQPALLPPRTDDGISRSLSPDTRPRSHRSRGSPAPSRTSPEKQPEERPKQPETKQPETKP